MSMFRLFQFLFTGCFHRWEIIYENTYVIEDEDTGKTIQRGKAYDLRCTRCGSIKRKKV